MTKECEFLRLKTDNSVNFRCHRSRALAVAKDRFRLDEGDFKEIGTQMCTVLTDEQRVKDCHAFTDLDDNGSSSEFAVRER